MAKSCPKKLPVTGNAPVDHLIKQWRKTSYIRWKIELDHLKGVTEPQDFILGKRSMQREVSHRST